MTGSVIHDLGMQAGHHDQPGHEGGILHGIPGPVAPEAEGFIGPGGAIMMPVPSTQAEKRVQGRACFIQSPNLRFHSPAMAKAKGTTVEAKPRNKTGG